MALPSDNNRPINASVVLGKNTNTDKDITITEDERLRSISVVGATGTGKSTLLRSMALQAVKNGESLIYIDVDDRSISELLVRIPQERMPDVIYLDFSVEASKDIQPIDRFIGINHLAGKTRRDVERYVELFKRLWKIPPEFPNLELTLRSTLLTLWFNKASLTEMPDLLRDKEFRTRCISHIPMSPHTYFIRQFWEKIFLRHDIQEQVRLADSTLNKGLQLLIDLHTFYIVSQETTTLNFADIIENNKILLIRLSKQILGEETVRKIGAMILEELKHALFSRDDLSKFDIVNLICDEWQLYLTPDFFEDVLSQGRRYGVSTVLATQTLENFDNKLQAILDQVGTHITFAVGVKDAYKLAPFYAKDPPPELKYEQIYEPEIIKSTKEVVTWEPPEAEQTYNQVEEELAELQAEYRDFELIKTLGLTLLHLVFGQEGTNKKLSSLKKVHILCNPDFQDIDTATSQKVIPAGSAANERKTRLPELYKKRSDLEEAQSRLERKRQRLEDAASPFLILWFFDFLWKLPFQKADDRENDRLLQAVRECEDEILAELEADRRYDNGYQYIIPATTLTPIEKNIDFLLHADDDFFVQLKGLFLPPHTFTVLKEKEEKEERENFFDRYISFLPSMLQLFTHPLPEMEVITATSSRKIPLTKREKTEITKYVRYLKLQIDMLLDRRDEAFVFIPQKGFQFIYPYGSSRDMADAKIYKHPELEDGTPYFSLHTPDYNPSNGWHEICAQGIRFREQRESLLDQERYLYLQNHYGYWHIHEHPAILAFFDAEIHRFSDTTFPKLNELQLLEKRHDDLLGCKKITSEEVIEYKAITLNTGEVLTPYFKQKYEKELKVSIGFSEGESIGRGKSESHGKSISLSEDKINLFRGKDGTTRTYTDMEKEKAKELLKLPDGIAYVSMRMRGDRFTPRMETKHLDTAHPRKGSLEKHLQQALDNAIPYTTEASKIDQEFWKRRQRFGIAPSPVVETPQEEESAYTPVPLHVVKRRVYTASSDGLPALSFDDDYLKLLYHFHYLTLEQICRLLGKTGKYDDTHVREDLNKLVEKGWITKEPIIRKVKAGRVPLVYSLTDTGMKQLKGVSAGTRKGTFSDHTLQVNDALITLVLAAKQEPSIRLISLKHERYFKQHNIRVGDKSFLEPDGFLHFQLSPPFGSENESVGVCLEIDLGSEIREQWQEKVHKYLDFASGIYQKQLGLESLTIAVCRPGGNVRELVRWTKQALELQGKKEYSELFLFTDRNPVDCDPVEWVTAPVWIDIDNTPYALIEKTQPQEQKMQQQPAQPAPISRAQLTRVMRMLTRELWQREKKAGIIDPSIEFNEWHTQKVNKLLEVWEKRQG